MAQLSDTSSSMFLDPNRNTPANLLLHSPDRSSRPANFDKPDSASLPLSSQPLAAIRENSVRNQRDRLVTVLVRFHSSLDAEAYAARIAAAQGYSASSYQPPSIKNKPTDIPHVMLADRCNGSTLLANGEHLPTVVLVDARSATTQACSCCRRVSKACDWPKLLDILQQTAGLHATRQSDDSSTGDFAHLDPDHKEEALRLATLTPRELEVLRLIGQGMSVRQSAESLGVAQSTIGNHKYRLMRKLDVKSSLEALRIAVRHGVANL